jgi:hypothetical protein
MDTDNEMGSNGCYIEHEILIVNVYGEEIRSAGWNPQLTLRGDSQAASAGKLARDDFEEMINGGEPLRSRTFPKCP